MKHLTVKFTDQDGQTKTFFARKLLDYCEIRNFAISVLSAKYQVVCEVANSQVSLQDVIDLVNQRLDIEQQRFEKTHKQIFFHQGSTNLPNTLVSKWIKK